MTTVGTLTTRLACVAICCARCSRMVPPQRATGDAATGDFRCRDRVGCVRRMRAHGRTPTWREDEAARLQAYRARRRAGRTVAA